MARQLSHTTLEIRHPLFPDSPPAVNPSINKHMQTAVEAGWDLITVTQVQREGGHYSEVTYTFFWRREAPAGAGSSQPPAG